MSFTFACVWINSFFEINFLIKINAIKECSFDRSMVIFNFGRRIKIACIKYMVKTSKHEINDNYAWYALL